MRDLPDQRSTEKTQGERSKRQTRAERILDAATTLILRWGFDKTTMDDIAREAGVAKATIYLHWKTREDLLMALMNREALKVAEDMRQRVANDPTGAMLAKDMRRRVANDPTSAALAGFVKHVTLALVKNPLMKALLLGDSAILGKWVSKGSSAAVYAQQIANYQRFLEFMREQGIVRTDISIDEQTYILSAVWTGFITLDYWMPGAFNFSDEEMADMLAETLQRVIAPAEAVPDQAGQEKEQKNTFDMFKEYLDRQIQAMKEASEEQET